MEEDKKPTTIEVNTSNVFLFLSIVLVVAAAIGYYYSYFHGGVRNREIIFLAGLVAPCVLISFATRKRC
jgi:hypothetical protein